MAKSIFCSKCRNHIEEERLASKQSFCRKCQSEYLREYRKIKNYLTIGKDTKKKHSARTMANTYLKRGNLKKECCRVCGEEKVEMHHDNYDEPLVVLWFCRKHHIDHHKKLKNVL